MKKTDKKRQDFLTCCVMFAAALSGACGSLDQAYSSGKRKLPVKGKFSEDDVSAMVCGGLLLCLLGVIAENDEGEKHMQRAVECLKHQKYPLSTDIRIKLNALLDTLGVKDERHRWN
jgi:hypothetical protein